MLRRYIKAIGLTIIDIVGIQPNIKDSKSVSMVERVPKNGCTVVVFDW